jgi:hypothetical protein
MSATAKDEVTIYRHQRGEIKLIARYQGGKPA